MQISQVLIISGALELNPSNAPPHQLPCQGALDDVPHHHGTVMKSEGHCATLFAADTGCCVLLGPATDDDATPLDDNGNWRR